jgi:hypothetical protein
MVLCNAILVALIPRKVPEIDSKYRSVQESQKLPINVSLVPSDKVKASHRSPDPLHTSASNQDRQSPIAITILAAMKIFDLLSALFKRRRGVARLG